MISGILLSSSVNDWTVLSVTIALLNGKCWLWLWRWNAGDSIWLGLTLSFSLTMYHWFTCLSNQNFLVAKLVGWISWDNLNSNSNTSLGRWILWLMRYLACLMLMHRVWMWQTWYRCPMKVSCWMLFDAVKQMRNTMIGSKMWKICVRLIRKYTVSGMVLFVAWSPTIMRLLSRLLMLIWRSWFFWSFMPRTLEDIWVLQRCILCARHVFIGLGCARILINSARSVQFASRIVLLLSVRMVYYNLTWCHLAHFKLLAWIL